MQIKWRYKAGHWLEQHFQLYRDKESKWSIRNRRQWLRSSYTSCGCIGGGHKSSQPKFWYGSLSLHTRQGLYFKIVVQVQVTGQHNKFKPSCPSTDIAQAANLVCRAVIDGLRKYSPPTGETNSWGKLSEAVTFCGSIPVVVLALLTSCPIYAAVVNKRESWDHETTHKPIEANIWTGKIGIVGPD